MLAAVRSGIGWGWGSAFFLGLQYVSRGAVELRTRLGLTLLLLRRE